LGGLTVATLHGYVALTSTNSTALEVWSGTERQGVVQLPESAQEDPRRRIAEYRDSLASAVREPFRSRIKGAFNLVEIPSERWTVGRLLPGGALFLASDLAERTWYGVDPVALEVRWTLILPTDHRLLAGNGDQALVLTTDALGAETVRLHRMRPSGR
jgi:hypothetical protein